MTAKEFLVDKSLQGVEIAGTMIMNLVVDNQSYGLSVNTSDISCGKHLTRVEGCEAINDIIKVGNTTLNLATTDML